MLLKKTIINTINEARNYINRNDYVAVYNDIKAKDNRVNLFVYHPKRFFDEKLYNGTDYNLGDYLGLIITEWMLQKKGLSLDSPAKGKIHLNTVGTNVFASYQDATIWGSGTGTMYELNSFVKRIFNRAFMRHLDVRAVRGPLTRDKLLKLGHQCPEVYGDPAILMPLIYSPPKVEELKKKDFLIIPQFLAEKKVRGYFPDYPIESMNTSDYKHIIDAIISSRKVITSSLHGIILAEAYGVPAVFFKSLKRDAKYRDYYASTGRYDVKIVKTVQEALQTEPMPLPDLRPLQQSLLESFPYDLWEDSK